MGTQGTGRKRSTKKDRSTAEDDALNLIAREAEARLAAKRAARAEAREIRMKELERQQKEVEDRDHAEKGPRAASALTSLGGTSSRRGSGETTLTVDAESSVREIKEIHELKDQIQDVETKYMQNLKEVKDALVEVEEKYRKAMVSNAQLDNEKNNLMYQVDTLKDSLMELEELLSESRREHQEKLKEFERQKHAHGVLQFQFNEMKETLKQSEELLNEIRQLRIKQDGHVREISDLQETVEWKDKKIGALERQKEYTDAIRVERDELREEVVNLKDVLKKHGIVLGPDLNINGDAGESGVDGSPGAEPAQDSQTSPTEGNSVLGGTEAAELRACGEEEVEPEQQEEILEENKEKQLRPDEEPPEEDETSEVLGSEESRLDGQITVDPIDRPASKAKAVIIVRRGLPQIQTSEDVPQTETSDSNSPPALKETETQSCDPSGGQETKQQVNEGGDVPPVVTTEPLPEEAVPVGPNAEPQQNPEEAENDEETPSKSQARVSAASGKKKKRKKKGKKKGASHENKDQQRGGTEKEQDSVVLNNGLTAESDTSGPTSRTLKVSKLDQDHQEPDKVEGPPEPSDNCSLKEPNTDPGSDGHDEEKKMSEEAEVLESTERPHLTETRVELVEETQNQEQTPETEKLEYENPKKTTGASSRVESGSKIDEDDEITGPDPEGNLLTSKSVNDLDRGSTSSKDTSTREDASGVQQSTKDPVSEDEGTTKNTEMLDQSDALGSSETSGHTGSRLQDQRNEEESPEAEKLESEEAAVPTDGFFRDEPLEESVPESKMVEDDGRGTLEEDPDPEPNLLLSKGTEDPNKEFPSRGDPSTISGIPEPNPSPVSGDQDQEETLISGMLEEAESPETPDDSREVRVEVLQNQEETSEPEKPESVLETTESPSQIETTKRPDESEMGEGDSKPSLDVKEMESATGPDPEPNLLAPGKSEDPGEEFTPDNSSPGDVSGVQNLRTESEAVDGDEKTSENMANNPESSGEEDGEAETHVPENARVPAEESRTGSEIKEERTASASNGDGKDQPTNPSMKELEVGPEEGPPEQASSSQIKDEVESSDPSRAETRETSSAAELTQPPRAEKEASPEPKNAPNNEETNSSPSLLAEQMNESNNEGNASPPHVQLDSDEEDGEEDEGQSFDFDDSDMEAAIESSLSSKPELEGAEVNRKASELCQSNTETEGGEEKVSEDDLSKVNQLEEGSDLPLQISLPCGDATPEEVENVPENIEQKSSTAVEEGLDAAEVPSDSPKTPEQAAGAKEVPQSGKESKKKKGKGKSKEDCKMS